MKTALYCLLIALAMRFAYGQIMGSDFNRVLLIKGRIKDTTEAWLTVEGNAPNMARDGFTPSSTRIFSRYQPLFRKTETGQWEIKFSQNYNQQ